MKTVTVTMSDEQAARYSAIARCMKREVGDILLAVASQDIECWDSQDEANSCLTCISDALEDYVDQRQVPGRRLNALLEAGTKKMPVGRLIKLARESERYTLEKEKSSFEIRSLIEQGLKLVKA